MYALTRHLLSVLSLVQAGDGPEQGPRHTQQAYGWLEREKRKKIQQNRRKVADASVVFDVLEGSAISQADWDFFYRCYPTTYQAHHSTPYLNRDFLTPMASDRPHHGLMFVATWRD